MAKAQTASNGNGKVTSQVTAPVINANDPLDAYLAELGNRQDQLIEAFAEVTNNESGGTGLEAGLAAANRLAFPTDVLLGWDPSKKDDPVASGLERAVDLADPFVSADWRAAMAEALKWAVNGLEDTFAIDARYGDNGTQGTGPLDKPEFGKVPKLNREKDKGPTDYIKMLADKVASTSNDPKLSKLYQDALNAAQNEDVDAVRRMARALNKVQVTAGKRANMVYLPIIISQLREYDAEVTGTAAPTAGTIWNEADAKAKAGHRKAYKDKDGNALTPSRDDVLASIAAEVKTFLYGDGNGNAGKVAIATGKGMISAEEQLKRAEANLYAAARKIDDLTGGKDDIHAKVLTMLRHLVPDREQDKLDAAKEEERQKAIAAVAEAERLKAERVALKAEANAAKATPTTKATGADVARAQAEVDAARKATGKATAPAGRAKPATGKPTPVTTAQAASAELDQLETAIQKPASAPTKGKAPAGKRS